MMKNFSNTFFVVLACNDEKNNYQVIKKGAEQALFNDIPCIIDISSLTRNEMNENDIMFFKENGVAIMCKVSDMSDYDKMPSYVDIFYLSDFLARQTDYIVEGGKRNLSVNLAKGCFMSPLHIKLAYEKYTKYGNNQFFVTDKGFVFGTNDTVFDLRAAHYIKELNLPCIGDASDFKKLSSDMYKSMLRGQIASGCNGVTINLTSQDSPDKTAIELNDYNKELTVLYQIYNIVNR